MWHIGVIGIGVLGNAICETFTKHRLKDDIVIKQFDKYKAIGKLEDVLECSFIFLCLPTLFNKDLKSYDISEINNVCCELVKCNYMGIVVVKSTVEPGTCEMLNSKYKELQMIHNPEFLTARTAVDDFANQKHIILGMTSQTNVTSILEIVKFYKVMFNAVLKEEEDKIIGDNNNDIDDKDKNVISICSSVESEMVKIACNSFYATKIQFFTEMKLLCDKIGVTYDSMKGKMLMNGWINPMHTDVPGHDGKLSFGGACFPKDIKALCAFMEKMDVSNDVVASVVSENIKMREC